MASWSSWARWQLFVTGFIDYLLATGLAVEIAVVHNFLWHERFTWADRPSLPFRQSLVRLAKFNVSNRAVPLIGDLGLMRVLVGEFGVNYIGANAVAIVLCSLANFWPGIGLCLNRARIRRRSLPRKALINYPQKAETTGYTGFHGGDHKD